MTTTEVGELEIVDDLNGIVLRRLVVGPLRTNCWLIFPTTGHHRAIMVDPGDEPERILHACADLDVKCVVLTHKHWDHVLGLPDVVDALGTEVCAHPEDAAVWPGECRHLAEHGHFDAGTATETLKTAGCHLGAPAGRPLWEGDTRSLADNQTLLIGEVPVRVLHTPGHTPGGISLSVAGHVLTGDTLFPGGPGLAGWPLYDFETIIGSVRDRLFTLPTGTHVHPGHGASTTIGTERPHLQEWIRRGW